MRQNVPTWLAVVVILLVIAAVVGIFALSGRRQTQEMPEGFKPTPPKFKEAPTKAAPAEVEEAPAQKP